VGSRTRGRAAGRIASRYADNIGHEKRVSAAKVAEKHRGERMNFAAEPASAADRFVRFTTVCDHAPNKVMIRTSDPLLYRNEAGEAVKREPRQRRDTGRAAPKQVLPDDLERHEE
jgi:hypothetical protein